MKAVIFDFDGTIADSFGTVMAIAYHLTQKQQLADIEHVKLMRDNNVTLAKAVKALKIPKWQWPWLLKRGRRLMAERIHRVPVFPGVEDLLVRLKEDKFQLFIISTNSTANVERFLVEKNLLPYFDRVYGGAGLFDKSKVIKRVLKSENINTQTAIYVGDEVRDIEAARQVGIPCIAVSWGYNSAELLKQYEPLSVTSDPKQLEKVILSWGSVT